MALTAPFLFSFLLIDLFFFSQAIVSVLDPKDDIEFEAPDIVAQYYPNHAAEPNRWVTLEAFKVRNRNNLTTRWVSVGYPGLMKTRNGKYFQFSTEYVKIQIDILNGPQKESLIWRIKARYPNLTVNGDNIIPMPLVKFMCTISFRVGNAECQIRGSVYDLRSNPFSLRFKLPRGDQLRADFEKRIAQNDPLHLECELKATGKQEKINSLKITRGQLNDLNLTNEIFGPANERVVTRFQLTELSQIIRSRLHIEEEYEVNGDEFSEEFIWKILEDTRSRFEPIDIDQALGTISKYAVSFDRRDLSPTVIKRIMKNILKVEAKGANERIVVSESNRERSRSELSGSTGGKGWWEILDLGATIDFVLKKSSDWEKSGESVTGQLLELNQKTLDSVIWEREGMKIIPKKLNVAKVTKMRLGQEMEFSRIRKRIRNAPYSRLFELSTED